MSQVLIEATVQARHERAAFTLREFWTRNSMSGPTYYKMKAAGLGPREMRIGGKILISAQAEADWHFAREHPGEDERIQIKRQAEVQKRRSALAASSTRHVAEAEARR